MKQVKQQLLLTVALLLCSIGIANAEVLSGSCGDNVTYSLDTETGVLNIEGTGAMTNWNNYDSYAPWWSNKSYIKSASISDGVTSIGKYAFYRCSGLTSVTIPNSVTAIGSYAFYYCSGLTSVTIGNSVTSIGNYAFQDCFNLTSVTIGNSVTSIGKSAFNGCTKLYEVYNLSNLNIESGSTSNGYVGYYAQAVHTSLDDPSIFQTVGDFLFLDSEAPVLHLYTGNATDVVLPKDFLGKNYEIGSKVFINHSEITSVTIPNSVTSIGNDAFYNCTKLYEVYNLSNLNIESGSTGNGYVGYYAQAVHTSLDDPSIFQTVGDFFFLDLEAPVLYQYTGNATDVVLPKDFKGKNYEIGNRTFYRCSGLTSVTIPNSVTSIGEYAFSSCSSLTSVTIPNSVTSIGNDAFSLCSCLTSVIIPNSVTSIGNSAFSNCSGLTSVTIGNSVTSIGDYAFFGCSGLTSITIPNSVTSIGNSAFRNCM